MGLGYTRKELGKLHRQFYEERLARNTEEEAFLRALMSMIKATLDVIAANNRKLEEDLRALLNNHKSPE